MGEVIPFPDTAYIMRGGRYIDINSEPATVTAFPIIRLGAKATGTKLRVRKDAAQVASTEPIATVPEDPWR